MSTKITKEDLIKAKEQYKKYGLKPLSLIKSEDDPVTKKSKKILQELKSIKKYFR